MHTYFEVSLSLIFLTCNEDLNYCTTLDTVQLSLQIMHFNYFSDAGHIFLKYFNWVIANLILATN